MQLRVPALVLIMQIWNPTVLSVFRIHSRHVSGRNRIRMWAGLVTQYYIRTRTSTEVTMACQVDSTVVSTSDTEALLKEDGRQSSSEEDATVGRLPAQLPVLISANYGKMLCV